MAQLQSPAAVLIAGAGPSGLMLGFELARRGIDIRVIDRLPRPSDKSRAIVVQARTIEIFEQLGLEDALLSAGARVMRSKFFVDGKEALELEIGDVGIEGAPYPFLLNVAQDDTERILTDALRSAGREIERGVELVSFEQDARVVRSRLRHPDGREEVVESQYLVGCDGAHSVVRHILGIGFVGDAYPQDFVLADVDVEWGVPPDQLRIFLDRDGVFAAIPMKGGKKIRLIASRRNVASDAGDPTLEEFQAIVDHFSPMKARLSNPHWLARFRLHHRLAERYSAGRAFLCGDAAHIHSPAGGQGMNTGLQDAYNLGWKLALAIEGRAGGELLDSYNAERRPVGRFLLQTTDRLFQMATGGGAVLSFVRRHVAPTLARTAAGHAGFRRMALSTITQLGIQYQASPIVQETPEAHRLLHDGPKAGDRAPDGALIGEGGLPTRLFLATRSLRHRLLLFAAGPRAPVLDEERLRIAAALEAAAPGLVDVFALWTAGSPDAGNLLDAGEVHSRYGARTRCAYLVRPDGHVGWRGPSWSLDGPTGYLARLLAET